MPRSAWPSESGPHGIRTERPHLAWWYLRGRCSPAPGKRHDCVRSHQAVTALCVMVEDQSSLSCSTLITKRCVHCPFCQCSLVLAPTLFSCCAADLSCPSRWFSTFSGRVVDVFVIEISTATAYVRKRDGSTSHRTFVVFDRAAIGLR